MRKIPASDVITELLQGATLKIPNTEDTVKLKGTQVVVTFPCGTSQECDTVMYSQELFSDWEVVQESAAPPWLIRYFSRPSPLAIKCYDTPETPNDSMEMLQLLKQIQAQLHRLNRQNRRRKRCR